MLRQICAAVAIGAVVQGAGGTWAQATISEFTAREIVNFGIPDEVRVTGKGNGKITHILGLNNINDWVDFVGSETDKLKVVGADGQGTHDVFLDVHINQTAGHPKFGHGTFSGTSVVIPGDDLDGIWECKVSGQIGFGRAQAVCHGTGVLEGQQLLVRSENGAMTGRILVPAATSMAAVPEPTTAMLAALGLLGFTGGLCRNRNARE